MLFHFVAIVMVNILSIQDASALPSDVHIHLHTGKRGVGGNNMENGSDYSESVALFNFFQMLTFQK